MKRIIGQILTLGAYNDWQKLPTRDKVILPLCYVAIIALYYIATVVIKSL